MREVAGDLWTYPAAWKVIPTNGITCRDGALVMGRGVAYQAAQRWPSVARLFGGWVQREGLRVGLFTVPTPCEGLDGVVSDFLAVGLVYFPVKYHWKDRADLLLLARSAGELAALFQARPAFVRRREQVALPRVGCGNGRLVWDVVRPVLAKILTEDNFVVVHPDGKENR